MSVFRKTNWHSAFIMLRIAYKVLVYAVDTNEVLVERRGIYEAFYLTSEIRKFRVFVFNSSTTYCLIPISNNIKNKSICRRI